MRYGDRWEQCGGADRVCPRLNCGTAAMGVDASISTLPDHESCWPRDRFREWSGAAWLTALLDLLTFRRGLDNLTTLVIAQ
jgi:hypothetical protein